MNDYNQNEINKVNDIFQLINIITSHYGNNTKNGIRGLSISKT